MLSKLGASFVGVSFWIVRLVQLLDGLGLCADHARPHVLQEAMGRKRHDNKTGSAVEQRG
jgi:hypothetical protein